MKALERHLRDHMSLGCLSETERSSPMVVRQFPGGHSNLTYLVRFGEREFVLRRPPLGPVAPTAHDMPREYRILSLVHTVFPLAPRPYFICGDPAVIGAPFYLMERRRGLVVRRDLPGALAEDVRIRARISESLIGALVDLHAVDIDGTGIRQIGRPEGFLERQIRGWAGRWERARTTRVPEFEAILQWLLEKRPESQPPALVHNDFKLDNLMLDPRDPSVITAVLDWEMCTVGDPIVDLGLLLCYWPQPDDPVDRRESISSVTTLPGWLKREDLVRLYAEKSGRDVSRIHYYEAFALFKVAVVIQQIYYRFHRGQTQDERFADFGDRAAGLLQAAWLVARGA